MNAFEAINGTEAIQVYATYEVDESWVGITVNIHSLYVHRNMRLLGVVKALKIPGKELNSFGIYNVDTVDRLIFTSKEKAHFTIRCTPENQDVRLEIIKP